MDSCTSTVPASGAWNPDTRTVCGARCPTTLNPSNTVRLRSGSPGAVYTTVIDQPA